MHDHLQHIKELSELLERYKEIPPDGASLTKEWITKGKVALANLMGDDTILMALQSNEIDTNAAYERLKIHKYIWPDAQFIINNGLADERKHKKWIETVLEVEQDKLIG